MIGRVVSTINEEIERGEEVFPEASVIEIVQSEYVASARVLRVIVIFPVAPVPVTLEQLPP